MSRSHAQSQPPRHCPYCGVPIHHLRLVCPDHSDLPGRDPFFTNRRIVAKPVGVQPFATSNGSGRFDG